MNTTELVRFVERAEPRHKPQRRSASLFYTELAGPARQAILRARQHLLYEQNDDGSWIGRQTSDASLASRLIFLLGYAGDERSHRAQQAAGAILDLQLPTGGWSAQARGEADLSISVQAYFALKLSGIDPTDERMSLARRAIRNLGGADMADSETRYFLALFGQVNYDVCTAAAPELPRVLSKLGVQGAVTSIIWSHRPVREVGIECGSRELFINRPETWPKSKSLLAVAYYFFERRGWIPFRRRALERAEKTLRHQVAPTNITSLDFTEVIWCIIALSSVGYSDDGAEMKACNGRLEDLIHFDEELDRISPQLRTTPVSDTLALLESIRQSGVATDHPNVTAAIRFLSRSRRKASPLAPGDIRTLLRLLAASSAEDEGRESVLPPNIEVGSWRSDARSAAVTRIADRVRPLIESLVKRILGQQKRDGSWGTVDATADVLNAIGHSACDNCQPALACAISYLRRTQQGDGSWTDQFGASSVRTTALAVRGLVAAGVPIDDELIRTGINWLAVHQRSDGGWGEPMSTTSTAMALSAFTAADLSNHAAALRAVQFLTESQDDRGGWVENGTMSYDTASGRWYRDDLHASAHTLSALSQWAVAAASAQPATAEKPSLRLIAAAAEN